MENTGQLRRFPALLKTVKIKQAKPYYRSLKEQCWVSKRARDTEREGERMRERQRGITLVRVWPSQCVQKWKAWNWIPTFLWLYDEWVRNAAALHMSFHTTSAPACRAAVYLHNKMVYQIFSGQRDSRCIFLDHPPDSSRQLAQSKFSLPPSVPRIPPWAVGKVPTTC